jgi:hypothetical protein
MDMDEGKHDDTSDMARTYSMQDNGMEQDIKLEPNDKSDKDNIEVVDKKEKKRKHENGINLEQNDRSIKDNIKDIDKKSKKRNNISTYKVAPITDKNVIHQLYTKNSVNGIFCFGNVKGKIAPYCSPTMYYVCYKCGLASQDGRKVEEHVKNCHNSDNKKLKMDSNKHINLDSRSPSETKPRFGWYNGERYLVIEKWDYAFPCVCGGAFDSARSLQNHFKHCPYTENILPTVGASCMDLDGILPIRLVNDKDCNVKFDSYTCGFDGRGVDDLKFCYNIPSKKMLTGQCQSTCAERKQYKIINYIRQIDAILNKNWIQISELVKSKDNKELYTDEDRDQWGAGSIQCERIEIGVTSEEVIDGEGAMLKIRGNDCWKMIEVKYDITATWMYEIVTYAKAMAQADTTQNEYMSFDSFSLILTKSDTSQQEHIDLLHPLSQYALTFSNDVDTTIAYRVKKEIEEVNSMFSLCNQLSSELLANGTKPQKFKNLFKEIKNIDPDSPVGKMIVKDRFGELFQIRIKNKQTIKNSKYESAYIKHAPTATYTRIRGSQVHSGSGVFGDRVRCILFWSGKPLWMKNMYDPDVQQTMFSVMIEIIQVVWINNTHDSILRKEMVELLYLVFNLCGRNYKKNGQSYRNEKINKMIEDFNNTKQSEMAVKIDELAAMLDLFVKE